MMEAAPGTHRIRLPMVGGHLQTVNCYLIEGGDGFVLVDCGWDTPETLRALQGGLRALGADLGDIRTLVATHFHIDHYGLAGTLTEIARPRVMLHRLDWLYLRDHQSDAAAATAETVAWMERNGLSAESWGDEELRAIERFRRVPVVRPDVELEDGDRIEAGGRVLQVVWTPGHTGGHVCLYDPERRVLLSGDHVLRPMTPHVSVSRPAEGDLLGDCLRALRKVAALEVDLVLPGHGEPFTGLRQRVEELLAHHARREAAVLEALSHGPATAAGVAALIPWGRRTAFGRLGYLQQRVALGQTLAHLEKLRAEGLATRIARNGRVCYEPMVAPT